MADVEVPLPVVVAEGVGAESHLDQLAEVQAQRLRGDLPAPAARAASRAK